MSDSAASSNLVIPDETKKRFGDVLKLILGSESMNDEERQYWINILPVMTDEQIASLKDILDTERRQLAAIDKKYAKEIEAIGEEKLAEKTDMQRRKHRTERQQKESAVQEADVAAAEALLKEIES